MSIITKWYNSLDKESKTNIKWIFGSWAFAGWLFETMLLLVLLGVFK